MRYRQLIDDAAFLKEQNSLQTKISQLKGRLRETEARAERWLELTEKTFNFATYARKAFLMAEGKEEINAITNSGFIGKPINTRTFAKEVSQFMK